MPAVLLGLIGSILITLGHPQGAMQRVVGTLPLAAHGTQASPPSITLADVTKILITAAISIAATYWFALSQRRFTRRHAQETRELSKPNISIHLFGKDLRSFKKFVLLHPGSPSDSVLFTMQIAVANASEVGCDDAVLTVQASRECIDDAERFIHTVPGVYSNDMRRSVVPVGQASKNLSYRLPVLLPRSGVRIEDQFAFDTTVNRRVGVDSKTADGVAVKIQVGMNFAYPFVMSVLSMQCQPTSGAFNVLVAAVPTLEKFREQLESNHVSMTSLFKDGCTSIVVVQSVVSDQVTLPDGSVCRIMSPECKVMAIEVR